MTIVENKADRKKFLLKNKFNDILSNNSSPGKFNMNRYNQDSNRKSVENFDSQPAQNSTEQLPPAEEKIKSNINKYVEATEIGLHTDSSVPFQNAVLVHD